MGSARRIVFAAAAFAAALGVHAQEDVSVTPALAAAEAWLAILDAGRPGEAWDQATPAFQEAVPRLKWETGMESTRAPLGTVIYRKLRQATYSRALPDAPVGEHVVIQYDTRFENRPLTTEIVTPAKATDGTWRVSGYVIR